MVTAWLLARTGAMPMERHQAVARVWNWLPAFRAVAEYEGLQRAALALSVSPSALSRTVSLLEETLGVALFVRSASGLSLTEAGQQLVSATRDAMRRVHDGLPTTEAAEWVRAGAVGPALRTLLGDEAIELVQGARLALREVPPGEVCEVLRRGDVDVVLAHVPVNHPGLRCDELPSLAWVLAAPPGVEAKGVVSLGGEGLEWPDAMVIVNELSSLPRAAERLGAAMFGPAFVTPSAWRVIEPHERRRVFWVEREHRGSQPRFLSSLQQRLIARLSGR